MKRLSLYKLIKKYRNYSHVSIFFNNRITKRIRFGYKFYQRGFKDAKRLKFLKINVRQPRLPVKRKTKYGKILEQRQKLMFIMDSGRRHTFLRYMNKLYRGNRSSSLNTFVNFSNINPFFFFYSFGFTENPAFLRFFSRYYEQNSPVTKSVIGFRYKRPIFLHFNAAYWYYFLSTFKFRARNKLIFFFFTPKNYFFNLKTFGFYPFKAKSVGVGSYKPSVLGHKNALPRTFLRFF